jgi:putative transposase
MFEPGPDGRKKPESLYGAVKAWAHLRRQGVRVARCTVERLMRANGWRGNVRGPRKIRTTIPDPAQPRHPDLVNRDFRAPAPGQLLVADFTYVPLAGGGFAYTAFVIDVFAGTIVGWECSLSKETAFVQRAISQAAAVLRRAGGGTLPGRAVHHSDAGSQYTSVRFAETLMLAGIAPSVGSVGDAYDNALAETTIGLYKAECTRDGSPFRDGPIATLGGLEKITAGWVHWYNTQRLMHRLKLRPPAEADTEYRNNHPQAQHPLKGPPGLTRDPRGGPPPDPAGQAANPGPAPGKATAPRPASSRAHVIAKPAPGPPHQATE